MKYNLPIIIDNKFFYKIKRFFYKLLKKDVSSNASQIIEIEKITDISNEMQSVDNVKTTSAPSQIDMMRKERENTKLKDDIISMVKKKPEVIKKLSDERLIELEKMFQDKNEELRKKLEQLERESERLDAKLG